MGIKGEFEREQAKLEAEKAQRLAVQEKARSEAEARGARLMASCDESAEFLADKGFKWKLGKESGLVELFSPRLSILARCSATDIGLFCHVRGSTASGATHTTTVKSVPEAENIIAKWILMYPNSES